MIQIQIQKQIESYILGKLSDNEIDNLWMEFLNVPEWYDYFITEIHLRSLLKVGKSVSEQFDSIRERSKHHRAM